MRTNRDLVRRAVDAEAKSQKFYENLADLFSHEQRASAFWTDLAAEEMSHVKWLRDAERSLSEGSLSQLLEPELEKVLEALEAFLRSNRTPKVRNLDEAYLLAHEHENVELEPIFRFLAGRLFDNEETLRFMREINDHVQKVEDFPKTFGTSAERTRVRSSHPPG